MPPTDESMVSNGSQNGVSDEEASINEVSDEQASSEELEEASDNQDVNDQSDNSDSFSSLNPDELPPELQAVYKQMQRDYTNKTKEASDLRKKAELYDQLQQQELMQERFPTKPANEIQKTTIDRLYSKMNVDPSQLTHEQHQQMQVWADFMAEEIQSAINQHVVPIQNQVMTREKVDELKQLRSKYSDFNDHIPEIRKILQQNPNMSYEYAYKVATFDQAKDKAKVEYQTKLQQQKAKSMPTTKVGKTSVTPPKGSSFRDIFNLISGN